MTRPAWLRRIGCRLRGGHQPPVPAQGIIYLSVPNMIVNGTAAYNVTWTNSSVAATKKCKRCGSPL
jgi:hypothetical protein